MGTPQSQSKQVESDWGHPSHIEDRWIVIGGTQVIKKAVRWIVIGGK